MDRESYLELESILRDIKAERAKPRHLPFEFFKYITDNFSPNLEVGRGGFGVVYKGVLEYGERVVVKRLRTELGILDKQYENEAHLLRLKHKNIVRILGYCSETRQELIQHEGKYCPAYTLERLICLEYMPNGSLDRYIKDASSGLIWNQRFKIIKGICCGLYFLHEENQINSPVVHLDLTPANILLTNDMVPKITDFGLSRLIGEQQTRIYTAHNIGKRGYMAPEFWLRGKITKKSDIYSLGVIILETITGNRDYPWSNDTTTVLQNYVEIEVQKWRERMMEDLSFACVENNCRHIKKCIEIGLKCVNTNEMKRPTSKEIIENLDRSLDSSRWEMDREPYLELESILRDIKAERAKPRHLPFEFFEYITDKFSPNLELGRYGFGVVYKGFLKYGETVVVKWLRSDPETLDKQYENEANLFSLKHGNIVRILGYCSETRQEFVQYQGRTRSADILERLICLEYMPNGSLDHHIKDASSGLNWNQRYKIIRGICCGLHFLHEENQINTPVIHLELKPANILLTNSMVPKITDFGLSRHFGGQQTRIYTLNDIGTLRYMAPEYVDRGKVTKKSDIFSLGVIILETITGNKDYPSSDDTATVQDYVQFEVQKWRERRMEYLSSAFVENDCRHIEKCIEIGLKCVNTDEMKRPTSKEIIKNLDRSLDSSYVTSS